MYRALQKPCIKYNGKDNHDNINGYTTTATATISNNSKEKGESKEGLLKISCTACKVLKVSEMSAFSTGNQKHNLDKGSDPLSIWNFCARSSEPHFRPEGWWIVGVTNFRLCISQVRLYQN